MTPRNRRVLHGVVVVTAAVALLGLGWWAGRTALQPPRDPLVAAQPVTVPVEVETVGRSLTLSATARWRPVRTVLAVRPGVVTGAGTVDDVADSGDVLLQLDLLPVVVVAGEVPAFRDLQRGVRGPDVQQLQEFLDGAGFDVDDEEGEFSDGTEQAVRAWQRALGQEATGVVPYGALVFVPELPARVRIAASVAQPVAPGDLLAEVLAPTPDFVVPVTDEQSALIPPSTAVAVTAGDGQTWQARTADVVETEDGGQGLRLVGADGSGVCAGSCDQVPRDTASTWRAEILLVPESTGPAVPVAAVRTGADGRRFVRTIDGTEIDVEVVATANGLAVVDGVDAGTEVVLPGRPE